MNIQLRYRARLSSNTNEDDTCETEEQRGRARKYCLGMCSNKCSHFIPYVNHKMGLQLSSVRICTRECRRANRVMCPKLSANTPCRTQTMKCDYSSCIPRSIRVGKRVRSHASDIYLVQVGIKLIQAHHSHQRSPYVVTTQ